MSMRRNRRPMVLAGMCLIAAALACNAPGAVSPTDTPVAPSPTTAQVGQSTPTPPPAPTATVTPAPDVSDPSGCSLNAAYVADVSVPDDTEFEPGEAFTKVWRVRNSGTCPWEAGTQLVFVTGEPMGGPVAADVPSVAPGSNTDVSVDLVAPTEPGTYRSTWQLQSPEGVRFGSQVYVQIIVPEEPTVEPSEKPTEEPMEEATEEATRPDLVITALEVDVDEPRQGVPLHIVVTLKNRGGAMAESFRWAWRVCVHEGCEYSEAPGAFTLEPDEEVTAQMEYSFDGWANYTTEAWVDSREKVEEEDETNNTRQLEIPVRAGLPDLVVSAITFDPDPPVQGQDAIVRVSVHNQGSKPAAFFDVEWWASVSAPAPACEWTVADGLEAESTTVLECTYAYPSWYSDITTRAIVDVGGDVTEFEESNNSRAKNTAVERP